MECLAINVVNSKHSTEEHVMVNEWSRYLSFSSFPLDSRATPTRLAQAGFYYTGSGEKVMCFSCGLKHDTWTEDETVYELHRRLSPHCRFICGEETSNVSMHGGNGRNFPETKLKYSIGSESRKVVLQQKCVSDLKSETTESKTDKNECKQVTNSSDHSHENGENKRTLNVSCESNSQSTHKECKMSDVSTTFTNDARVRYASSLTNGQIELYPRISGQRPKHPDFALLRARQTSFAPWSSHQIQDPEVLARAGFYYAGMQDCVKCFFCGGGMKNWASGDNPWVEHAKWLPYCAYVKLCKGEEFVQTCHAARNNDRVASFDNELNIERENIPDDWLVESLNSVAAKIVLTAGYRQEDIEDALLLAKQKYGAGEIKAQYIMEHLQETSNQILEKKQPVCEVSKISQYHQKPIPSEVKGAAASSNNKIETLMQGQKQKSEKQKLQEENQALRDLITCKICLNNDACVAFLPCGHLATCVECSKSLKKCAICRAEVRATVRVYQA